MRRHLRKRKCKHCQTFFDPDPRNVGRQHYCAQPPCRQASKAASQRRWLHKPDNRHYFSGPTNVERVRQWRHNHPGYWRRKAPQGHAVFQAPCIPHQLETHKVQEHVVRPALQDSFCMQPAMVVGFIAPLTG